MKEGLGFECQEHGFPRLSAGDSVFVWVTSSASEPM